MKTVTITLAALAAVACAEALDLPRLVRPETLTGQREALAFTSEQEAKLARIYESAEADSRPLEEALRKEEKALADLLKGERVEAGQTETAFARLLEAENRLKHLQFTTLLALRAVLTPEQIEKAVSLAGRGRQATAPLMDVIEGKARRLKNAFDELGIKPGPLLESKGSHIRGLIESGDLDAANAALDALGKEAGVDEPIDKSPIEFSQQSPGDTALPSLESRFQAVQTAVKGVIYLPHLRRLLEARDAIEAAKNAEDAESVGRVLTWAENLLRLKTAP